LIVLATTPTKPTNWTISSTEESGSNAESWRRAKEEGMRWWEREREEAREMQPWGHLFNT